MYDTAALLHQAYEQRDAFLIVLLFVVGGLYQWADRSLRDLERFMAAHPGSKAQFDNWQRHQRLRADARNPMVICPLHKVFRNECPPGSHDDE